MFEDGDTEEWIKWRISFQELSTMHPLDTTKKKLIMFKTLLKGEAKT